MANEAAFELKEDFKETFAGASTAVGDQTFDIAEALESGRGYVVTKDPQVINALDGHEALKRAQLGDAKAAKKSKGGKG